MLQAAFYKGRMSGIRGLTNDITRLWLLGKYSHCEWIFSDGLWGSSSLIDGGVRLKAIQLNPDKWDVWPVTLKEEPIRNWFDEHSERKTPYDILGLGGFVARPLGHYRRGRFCSEAMAESAGFKEPWRLDPCALAAILAHPHIRLMA